jgi:ATP-dependent DNA helicase RecG
MVTQTWSKAGKAGRAKMQDWNWLTTNPEGQFFERKSCYDRSGGGLKRRPARDVARDIAETLAAMANADGGTVVVGMEDDGTPTGVEYPPDRLDLLLGAPQRLVTPPLKVHHQWVSISGAEVLMLEVDWSPEVHQLSDGRYVLRLGDKNMPFPASDIVAMKEGKRRRITESRLVYEASLQDLDLALLDELRQKSGLDLCAEELLRRYRLVESRNGHVVLSLAALLLFAKEPLRWHPACYVDFVKWEGKERRFGAELNVVKRERIEAPLPRLIQQTFGTIQPHIRERQRLIDLFFEERFEYPTFAWQEAIINAVAHRDWVLEGTPIEVWIFDDRLEVRSPGALVEPVTIERLQRRERVHASRNPRIVRVLTELGYMRELGEGVPRMFEVMEREGLGAPEFRLEAGAIFTVVLRNTPVYSQETVRWLSQFDGLGLSVNQKRLLAYAFAHGNRFTSRDYQKLAGVSIYEASRDIRELIRKGVVRLPCKGGRVYETVSRLGQIVPEKPAEYAALEPVLAKKGYVKNEDIREALGVTMARARRIADRLVSLGWLRAEGEKRGRRYFPAR